MIAMEACKHRVPVLPAGCSFRFLLDGDPGSKLVRGTLAEGSALAVVASTFAACTCKGLYGI